MTRYTKQYLEEIASNPELFKKEIKSSLGFVLYMMDEESVKFDLNDIFTAGASSWMIPYLHKHQDKLSGEQIEALSNMKSGVDWWFKSEVEIPSYDVELGEKDKPINIFHSKIAGCDNESSIYIDFKSNLKIIKQLQLEPIRNLDDLNLVITSLNKLNVITSSKLIGLKISNTVLAEKISTAMKAGGLELSRDDILKQSYVWVNTLSINREDRVSILAEKFNSFILEKKSNIVIASSLNIPVHLKKRILTSLSAHNGEELLLVNLTNAEKQQLLKPISDSSDKLFNSFVNRYLFKNLIGTIHNMGFTNKQYDFDITISKSILFNNEAKVTKDLQELMKKNNLESLDLDVVTYLVSLSKGKFKSFENFVVSKLNTSSVKDTENLFFFENDFLDLYFIIESLKSIDLTSLSKEDISKFDKLNAEMVEYALNLFKLEEDTSENMDLKIKLEMGFSKNDQGYETLENLKNVLNVLFENNIKLDYFKYFFTNDFIIQEIKEITESNPMNNKKVDALLSIYGQGHNNDNELIEVMKKVEFSSDKDCINITKSLIDAIRYFSEVQKLQIYKNNILDNDLISNIDKVMIIAESKNTFLRNFGENNYSFEVTASELLEKNNVNRVINLVYINDLPIKKLNVQDVLNIADKLKGVEYCNEKNHMIFENFFDGYIAELTALELSKKEMHDLLLNRFIEVSDELKQSPFAYLMFVHANKSFISNLWKYAENKDAGFHQYSHILLKKHLDVDVFNEGVREVYYHYEHQRESEGFQKLIHRLYHLTWERMPAPESEDTYDNIAQSFFTDEQKVKLFNTALEIDPQNILDKNVVATVNEGYDNFVIKDWLNVFISLSSNAKYTEDFYKNVELSSADTLIESFLNYDSNNLEVIRFLNYLHELVTVAKEEIDFDMMDDDMSEENSHKIAVDYFAIRNIDANVLPKVLLRNKLRLKEIEVLKEQCILEQSIPLVKERKVKSVKF